MPEIAHWHGVSLRAFKTLRVYLDDSGTNKQSPIVVMGGYVAPSNAWQRFEPRARRLFRDEGIRILRGKEFHDRDGCFAGWTVPRQMRFVTDLYNFAAEAGILLGLAHAVTRDIYKQRGVETGPNKSTSAYGWCFQMLLNRLLKMTRLLVVLDKKESRSTWRRATLTMVIVKKSFTRSERILRRS